MTDHDPQGGIPIPPEFTFDLVQVRWVGETIIPVPTIDFSKPQPTLEEVARLRGVTLLPEEQLRDERDAMRAVFDHLKARERRRIRVRKRGVLVVIVVAMTLAMLCWGLY